MTYACTYTYTCTYIRIHIPIHRQTCASYLDIHECIYICYIVTTTCAVELNLEGPSAQYLRFPTPKPIQGMAFGTRKCWELGRSGEEAASKDAQVNLKLRL